MTNAIGTFETSLISSLPFLSPPLLSSHTPIKHVFWCLIVTMAMNFSDPNWQELSP